ncbi:heavy-metal-associated domain-containing protein [Sediminicoccus rosea]|uniref:Heavy-metal-associated domain-containing protein n=1 Tax=Sediminicoccus rosea TaxID=1225128 RepID=A0ABZ0PE19_9PROT|nr:heavy-metal-associated domain-containing protein [Sediminicoccus rosea]WPB83955.1 heavy-metal-associated domain-containing protein [Sediminicoccus rosea]
MHRFHIPNMSCGHCVTKITQAVHSADPGARLQDDLDARSVTITSSASAAVLAAAIAAAGYANTLQA